MSISLIFEKIEKVKELLPLSIEPIIHDNPNDEYDKSISYPMGNVRLGFNLSDISISTDYQSHLFEYDNNIEDILEVIECYDILFNKYIDNNL
jgi:hypothetical protein